MYLLWRGWSLPGLLSETAKSPGSSINEGVLVSHTSFTASPPNSRLRLSATLFSGWGSFSLQALVDSGADDNFVDFSFFAKAGIPLERLPEPLTVNALDGWRLA